MHQQILVAVERQARIEAFVVITMALFYFTIVSRRPWTNKPVDNARFLAIEIEWMRSTCLPEMCKFKAIIRLYDFWLIAKMLDGHFDQFYTGVGRLLAEGVDKSLPTGFVNDRENPERYVLTA